MDESAALAVLDECVPLAGDDAAIVGEQVLTTDMLRERTDFPGGMNRYTAGWRAVGASLSDLGAMGAEATAAVAVYGSPAFDESEIVSFVEGARAVCECVDAEYVGGDLDRSGEFTLATTALGRASEPVCRSGAEPGEAVCVTGSFGRSAAALRLFEQGDDGKANTLFRFTPRVEPGKIIASQATSMMDSSDGLARSLHQLATASDCGFAVETPLPIDAAVDEVAADGTDRKEMGLFFGEDFELVFTISPEYLSDVRSRCDIPITRIGTVTATEDGVILDGQPLPDRGYTH